MNTLFILIPRIAKKLSSGMGFFEIISKLWIFVFLKKIGLNFDGIKINGFFYNKRITFYLKNAEDINVLYEVFVTDEYGSFPLSEPSVIIDLGANFGETALYYSAKFPSATVVAVEPSPENFQRLVKHTKDIRNIIPVQAAIGSIDGTVELNLMPSSLGHSVMQRKGSHDSVAVPMISLETLFKKYTIEIADVIKFDVEGAEFDWLRSIKPEKYAKAFIGEIHYDLDPKAKASEEEFRAIFSKYQTDFLPISKTRSIIKATIKI